MAKKELIGESFQPLSRGLISHLKYLSDRGAKLFTYCLLRVKAVGPEKGKMFGYVPDWCYDLGWDRRQKFYEVIKQMDAYLEFIPSGNRHQSDCIIVRNYKGIEDFYDCKKADSKTDSRRTVGGQYTDSRRTVTTPNLPIQNVLLAPNKEIRREGDKEDISITTKELPSDNSPIPWNPKHKPQKTPLPDDFKVSEAVKVWAKEKGFRDPETLLEDFKDHHLKNASLFADWDAALRTWVRKDAKFNPIQKEENPDFKMVGA